VSKPRRGAPEGFVLQPV
jgi:hypothetical protein